MAIKETYTDYEEVDYNAKYDLLSPQNQTSPHVTDTRRLELDPDDSLPAWQTGPDLTGVESMVFRYRAHRTSNANARDTLRYGTCETRTKTVMLWGFETFQEFKDHLAVRDKAWAHRVWSETSCELRQETIRYLFWVPKNEQHVTEPAVWAITMDHDNRRSVLIWADTQLQAWSQLKLSQQNRIRIGKQD